MRPLLALVAALGLAASPAFAHGKPSEHAKKGEQADAPRSFDKQPPVGTWAKCPVSGEIFKVGKETKFAKHQGRVYALCCDECAPDFEKDPAKYADRSPSAGPGIVRQ